ncbi:uncharacterized protein [Nicotiana sylvestris]|uniref:uncharacterized protein n=1 Tax=Nicotiana sylvestris TaxID=4096 RepID=UPI00388CAF64
MGGMVEEGLKSNKIMSYSAIKATTQVIQNGTRGVLGKKKKEEVANVESGVWSRSRSPSPYYNQPRPHHPNYPYTPYGTPQHYYPPPEPHISVHHAQTYTQPPAHEQWHAPATQNTYPAPQNTYPHPRVYRPGAGFRPNQTFRNEKVQNKRTFTPLVESYTTLFHRLKQLGMLTPVEPKMPNLPPRKLDHSVSCEYCSGMPGHDTKKCLRLKNAVQELIDNRRIEVQAPEAPNINQNPLPAHYEANMIELLYKGAEPKKPLQTVMMICSIEAKEKENAVRAKPTTQPKGVNDKPVVVIGKGSSVVAKKPEPAKLLVLGASSAPMVVVKGAYIEPVVLKPILNEAHVPETISVNHLETITNKIFEVNRVTFSDDELPVEGTKHNKALYVTVKCEDSVVTRVLIDNRSSANICPLSTPNKLKIEDDRIHKNSVCVRGFDGGGTNTVGDIILELTIGPVEFTMEFQVLDIAVSY